MATIIAENVISAVKQDWQLQTTNNTAILDYIDRTQQRMLRESKWRFLLSDPQTFITMPGVSGYTLIDSSAPAGAFRTNLNLSDFGNIAPGTVFNLTNWAKVEEDADDQTSLNTIVNKDGSLRFGPPRTYQNSLSDPGTIYIKPVPDDQNLYYPVPETPPVNYTPVLNCVLPNRLYFGVVTYVDSTNGESTQCVIPFTIFVPYGNVLVVSSPLTTPGGGIAGTQSTYSWWNCYVGLAQNSYWLQNIAPIAIGTNFTEPISGIYQGVFQVPSVQGVAGNTALTISSGGALTTTYSPSTVSNVDWALIDANGIWWQVSVDPITHMLETSSVTPTPYIKGYSQVFITDTSEVSSWSLTVSTGGLLQATVAATPPANTYIYQNPPVTSTIQPLNAYVMQFRYYKARNQITSTSDVLQIPYAYNDIVIAGVNYLIALYLDERANREPSAKTLIYKGDFDAGLAQIRRDLRVNYRKTDFIAPDIVSQTTVGNEQGIPTMGW